MEAINTQLASLARWHVRLRRRGARSHSAGFLEERKRAGWAGSGRARTLHGRGSRVGNVGIAHNIDCSVARGQPTLITPLILPRMHVWYFHVSM